MHRLVSYLLLFLCFFFPEFFAFGYFILIALVFLFMAARDFIECPTDFAKWRKVAKEIRHFAATKHHVEIAQSGAVFIPGAHRPKGVTQAAVTTLVEKHLRSEENHLVPHKEYTIEDSRGWDAREIQENRKREHTSVMTLYEILADQGLIVLDAEMPLGLSDILVNIAPEGGNPVWVVPVGRLDLLCLDSKGNLVILDLKTAAKNIVNPVDYLARRTYALQMEFYSFLLERLAKQLGHEITVAYHGLLLWHPYATAKNTQGTAHFLKLPRNQEYWMNNASPGAPFYPVEYKDIE